MNKIRARSSKDARFDEFNSAVKPNSKRLKKIARKSKNHLLNNNKTA